MSWADKKKPYVIGMLIVAAAIGGVLGYEFLSQDWAVFRRVFAGGMFGTWCAMLVLGGRLYL